MKSDQISEWITRYHEGTLEGKELEEFLTILAGDESIRRELEVEQEVTRALQDREALEFRKVIGRARDKYTKRRPGMFLLAASLAAIITIGGFLLYHTLYLKPPAPVNQIANQIPPAGTGTSPREIVEEQPETQPSLTPDHTGKMLLAENYTPLRSMESLVGEVTRADDIHVTSPPSSVRAKPGDRVTFTWKSHGSGKVTILVFDNRGDRIMEITPTKEAKYLLETGSLKGGLYYWKLLKDEKFVTAGKIRVE